MNQSKNPLRLGISLSTILIFAAIGILTSCSSDGECNLSEGAMFCSASTSGSLKSGPLDASVPYYTGNMPTGANVLNVSPNNIAISGGMLWIEVSGASSDWCKAYMNIEGIDGYYEIYNGCDISSYTPTNISVPLSPELADGVLNGQISVTDANGNNGICTGSIHIDTKNVGVGDLQISLSWNQPYDLDLWVYDPNGTKIYFDNKSNGTNGTLDMDANVDCPVNGKSNENIYFTAPLADGDYRVVVDLYSRCDLSGPGASYYITARYKGQLFEFSSKQNGKFPDSVMYGSVEIGTITVRNGVVVN